MLFAQLNIQSILLADDDSDDCLLFKDALEELPLSAALTTVFDGDQLMQHLTKADTQLPDILFLDLNMPRKNGFQCLLEIKKDKRLNQLPIVIFSTSYEPDIARQLYKDGAQYYIQKPNEFSKLKKVIYDAIAITAQGNSAQPSLEGFVLIPDSYINENR
jgi:CheY-like chemotaxis protein